MFGSLGVPELLFIFGLALLIFGPRRLPEIGRTLGRGMAEFRKATADVKRTINAELIAEEVRENDPRRMLRDSVRDVKDGLERAVRGDDDPPAPGTAKADDPSMPKPASGGVARGADLETAESSDAASSDAESSDAASSDAEPSRSAS